MKAPEKIYRTTTYLNNKSGQTVWKKQPVAGAENIEYTRTDAFIEKACAWLKENKDKYLYNTGERDEYIPTCSGKMIEDFRKYMKGE